MDLHLGAIEQTNARKKERESIIPDEECKEETEERVRKLKRLSLRCLGEGENLFCQERSRRNEIEITQILYIEKS